LTAIVAIREEEGRSHTGFLHAHGGFADRHRTLRNGVRYEKCLLGAFSSGESIQRRCAPLPRLSSP